LERLLKLVPQQLPSTAIGHPGEMMLARSMPKTQGIICRKAKNNEGKICFQMVYLLEFNPGMDKQIVKM